MPRILLIRTGGTIDAAPYDNLATPPPFVTTLKGASSLIDAHVASHPRHAQIDRYHWRDAEEEAHFVKDSQYFTRDDLAVLATLIQADPHRHILLTHGTSAMAQNAATLQLLLDNTDKTVVFVGAMVPLSMQHRHQSDGIAALDFAISHIADCPFGVSLVGYNKTGSLAFYDPAEVQKDNPQSLATLTFTVAPRK